MSSLDALKRNRSARFKELTAKVETAAKGEKDKFKDDRFWRVARDQKTDIGSAVIRFLPESNGDELPYNLYYKRQFQGPTGLWYIENCLSTIGAIDSDPVGQYCSELWNTGVEANKKLASKYKRNFKYISNILVIKDPAHPENEGKVFLYEYGKKIFAKINDVMSPEFEDQTARDPFDLWEGMDFRLRVAKKDGYITYDASEWGEQRPVYKDEEKIKDLYEVQLTHKLSEFTDPKNFRSYDELKTKFEKVIGLKKASAAPVALATELPVVDEATTTKTYTEEAQVAPSVSAEVGSEDTLEYFKGLADS